MSDIKTINFSELTTDRSKERAMKSKAYGIVYARKVGMGYAIKPSSDDLPPDHRYQWLRVVFDEAPADSPTIPVPQE